jgi:hypothetical protein
MKSLLIIILGLVFANIAQADFSFTCRKATSKEDCLKEFREYDSSCCFTGGKKLKDISNASQYCQVTNESTTCKVNAEDPNRLWRCTVKNSICSDVSGNVGYTEPPTFSCTDSKNLVVMSERMENVGWGGTARQKKIARPLFCVSKESAKKAVSSTQTNHR